MRRGFSATVIAAFVAAGCTGEASRDDTIPPLATNPPITAAESIATTAAPTDPPPPPSTATTTAAPSTRIDEDAVFSQVEANYFDAFEIGHYILRNPDDPENERQVRQHYTGANLDKALDNLRRVVDGGLIAKANPSNPSLATIVGPPEFVDDDPTLVRMTVCEFNSDRIFEVGTAPGGGDALVRDDPISILITIRFRLDGGAWKSQSGTSGDEIRSEEEQCTAAAE